jgi:DNA-binding protein WhiA
LSFTAEVKDELARIMPEHEPCRKAELSALVRIDGQILGRYRLEIAIDTAIVARIVVALIHSVYRLKTEVTTRRSVLHNNFNYLITIPAQRGSEEAVRDLGILGSDGLELGIAPQLVTRHCCLASYLRGIFLSGGFIANPRRDTHFELSCGHEALANGVVALLTSCEIKAKAVNRRNSWIVYIKDSESIVEFLALVGAHKAVLDIENVRITKSIRNDENRRVNAEIANQLKSVEASLSQVRTIQTLVQERGIKSLPPALRELATLRLAHPDVSLKELGELAKPPLSKGAVYHRVRRIEAIARQLALTADDSKNDSRKNPDVATASNARKNSGVATASNVEKNSGVATASNARKNSGVATASNARKNSDTTAVARERASSLPLVANHAEATNARVVRVPLVVNHAEAPNELPDATNIKTTNVKEANDTVAAAKTPLFSQPTENDILLSRADASLGEKMTREQL